MTLLTAPLFGVGLSLTPAAVVAVGAAAVGVVSATVAAVPAKASTPCSGAVLVFPNSVNGGSASAEAAEAAALGCTVTMFSASAVSGMTQAQMITYFSGFTAIIIGDPSTSTTCSSTVPSDALTYAQDWGPAVSGNIAILGTAPVLAGSAGTSLVDDALTWAVSGSSGETGLYASLNCEYSSASAKTAVPLLASVAGGGFKVTGQGSTCPSNSGTVNSSQALIDSPFMGLIGHSVGPWTSPACAMDETFNSWSGAVTGLAYDAGATPASFTASNASTGQPYILTGSDSAATQALSQSTGGQSPSGANIGGSNPAAPGLNQDFAGDPVNTENGDFVQSSTDFSIPTLGPALDFTRTYDAMLAQRETLAGTPVMPGAPGSLGYGWTDNWASSLTTGVAEPGSAYVIDGTRSDNGIGGPATSAPLDAPGGIFVSSGNVYIADSADNRVLEIPSTTGSQWGISMTAGDEYVIAGSPTGFPGRSTNGTAMASSLLDNPESVALDSSGNLYIADTGNNRVLEIPAVSGQNRGFGAMSVDDVYTIAGHGTGAAGHGGDGGEADDAFLNQPYGIATGHLNSDIYIADAGNNRIQEVPTAAGTQWNQTMTGFDIYTVAGSTTGSSGISGDGGAAASAFLNSPDTVSFSSAGDMYIADTGNNRIQEVPAAAGAQWGITPAFTKWDMYTVAGSATGSSGHSADGTTNTSALLNEPTSVVADNGTQLYVTDLGDNRVEEVARSSHSEWGTSMTANEIYTIAGTGTAGLSGDGGSATAAKLRGPLGVALDGSFDLYIADSGNSRVREVSASTADISEYAGNGQSMSTVGNTGPATAAALLSPQGIAVDPQGDVIVADSGNDRIEVVGASTHALFGGSEFAGAGEVSHLAGTGPGNGELTNGVSALLAQLVDPTDIAMDSFGNMYIADSGDNRIVEIAATNGVQWGISMTAGDAYTVAGSSSGASGSSGDTGPATSALLDDPTGIAVDAQGNLYIADQGNNSVREVFGSFAPAFERGDIDTIAGTGASGSSGDGGSADLAKLHSPAGIVVDSAGNLYIADTGNNRVQEVPAANGTQWGQSMINGDMYTIAGTAGSSGATGDNGPASLALLNSPEEVSVDASGDVFVADALNNRVQELAQGNGTQWGQAMTAGDIYTIAGSATGAAGAGASGNSGSSTSFGNVYATGIDNSGDLFLSDTTNSTLDEVLSSANSPFGISPAGNGVTVNQNDGSQVVFYPEVSGHCPPPYQQAGAGGYCTLAEDVSATLSFSSANGGTYTYSPDPDDIFTYGSGGALQSESDDAGDSLSITYGSPAPGSGACPALANSCETVTSASGRALTIGLNSSNFVTSVTDPMGREWTYGYSGDDLTSATDPMGNKTTYTYGPGSAGDTQFDNDLLTITDPNAQPSGPDAGHDTVNVYDQFGRVTSQTDPMGFVTTFNYCVNGADGNCMDSATGTGMVTVTDPDGNTSVADYSLGSLVGSALLASGTTLTSTVAFAPDQITGTELDSAKVNGDNEVGTAIYNSSGVPVSMSVPDGSSQPATITQSATALNNANCMSTAEATATCEANPGPTPVTPGGAITPPSSAPALGLTYVLYDTDGNELYATTGVYGPGASSASYSQTTYQLFNGNTVNLSGSNISCSATAPAPSVPCATINADGVVTQLSYDSSGDLSAGSAPDGNGSEQAMATYHYDADGELTSTVSPDGNITGANAGNYTTTTAYNADGEETSAVQGNGSGHTVTPRTTSYGYDADGNQNAETDARGFSSSTSYNADDGPVLDTDPDGNSDLSCYDGEGEVAQTVPAVGVAANGLNAASCPTSYPSGYSDRLASDATTYTYDANAEPTSMTTPAPAGQTGSETTTYTYDGAGNTLTVIAPPTTSGGTAQETVNTYDSTGQLTTATTGYGTSAAATSSYCYDPNGDRTSVVYADGNASAIASCETISPWAVSSSAFPTQAAYQTLSKYDSVGDLVSVTTPATSAAPSGATTSNTFGPAGNMLTSADPNGITATYTYNPANQIASVAYSGSSAHSVSYTYDAAGQPGSMVDGTGTSSYVFDPFGELTSETNGASQTVGYSYDSDQDVTGITYPLPSGASWATTDTVSYGYDHADNLTSVSDFNGNSTSIGNTADGLPNSIGLGSTGDTIATTYDNTDSPAAISLKNSTTTLQSFTYSDGPAGDVLSETDTPSSSRTPADYTYDGQGRVASMTPGTGSALSYSYDASGNVTGLATGATGSYDHSGELTSAALSGSTVSYIYNADGERTGSSSGGTSLTSAGWNGAGELTSYSNTAASMTAASYTGDGLRTSATSGGSTSAFVWDEADNLLQDSANAYIYAGAGTAPVEQVNLSTGAVTYLVADSLGSVRGAVSHTGALTATTSYDAWGNPLTTGGLSASTPFGFAGGYTDPDGLIYLINRYYDPSTGQFISVDPDLSQTLEPYAYANDDPITDTDPNGGRGCPPCSYTITHVRATYHHWLKGPLTNGMFAGDWKHCLYVSPQTGTDTWGCYEGVADTTEVSVTLSAGLPEGLLGIALGYSISVTKSWQTEFSVTVKPNGEGWIDYGFVFYKEAVTAQKRKCTHYDATNTTKCGHWSWKRSGTTQKWEGETYHYFGSGSTGTCNGPKSKCKPNQG